jgi:hypothetical protein
MTVSDASLIQDCCPCLDAFALLAWMHSVTFAGSVRHAFAAAPEVSLNSESAAPRNGPVVRRPGGTLACRRRLQLARSFSYVAPVVRSRFRREPAGETSGTRQWVVPELGLMAMVV